MSSQQGPKAAPGQHSAHILLRLILREPQSTSANFLGDVGEGSNWLFGRWPLAAFRPRFIGYTRCGIFNMRPSCACSRLGTETFQEKSARLLSRSSSIWSYSSILQPG